MKKKMGQYGGEPIVPFENLFNDIYIVHGNNSNMIPLFINYNDSNIFIKIHEDQKGMIKIINMEEENIIPYVKKTLNFYQLTEVIKKILKIY